MTPLEAFARYLAHRGHAYEKVLPLDDPDDPRWDKYRETAETYTRVQAQLTRPLTPREPEALRRAITRAPRRPAEGAS